MFGLSIIMTTPLRSRVDVDPFLEQAVLTYQSRGTLQLDAMRSTLLYYEGYRTIGDWRSVGVTLLRAAGEVSFKECGDGSRGDEELTRIRFYRSKRSRVRSFSSRPRWRI